MTAVNPAPAQSTVPAPGLAFRILVVEDEAFLASLLHDILLSAGYRVVHASRVDAALQILRGGTPIDAALLDIDLNGIEVFPVADALLSAQVPFVFASGYGREGLPSAYAHCPVVQKPYLPDSITSALSRCLSESDPG